MNCLKWSATNTLHVHTQAISVSQPHTPRPLPDTPSFASAQSVALSHTVSCANSASGRLGLWLHLVPKHEFLESRNMLVGGLVVPTPLYMSHQSFCLCLYALCFSFPVLSPVAKTFRSTSGMPSIFTSEPRIYRTIMWYALLAVFLTRKSTSEHGPWQAPPTSAPAPSAHLFVSVMGPHLKWSHRGHERAGWRRKRASPC